MGYLRLRGLVTFFQRLCFVCRVFINSGCNRHTQTSRLVTGAEIQTSYYFEENPYDPNCLVDLFHRRHINLLLRSSCKVVVRRCNLTSLSNYLIFVLCSFFLILRHNQIKVQDHLSQRQQNQSISLNIARYRKAVTGALWVHTALVVSYLSSLITAVVGTRTGYAIIGLPCQGFYRYLGSLKFLIKSIVLLLEDQRSKAI